MKQLTFLRNFSVSILINAELTALMKEKELSKVTLPDPIGYLYLSVSIPKKSLINKNCEIYYNKFKRFKYLRT